MAQSRGQILIVEDEEAVGKLLAVLAGNAGFTAHLAADGEEALEVIRAAPEPFLVVLADKNLPRRSGLEVLAGAKEHAPDTEVLLMTAHPSLELAIEVLHLGGAGFLAKPFESLEKVLAELEKAAKKARENRVVRAQLRELEAARAALDGVPVRKVGTGG